MPISFAQLLLLGLPQGGASSGHSQHRLPEAHKQGCRETIAVSMYREIYSVAYQHCGRCGGGARVAWAAWAAWARSVGGSDRGRDNASRVGVATRSHGRGLERRGGPKARLLGNAVGRRYRSQRTALNRQTRAARRIYCDSPGVASSLLSEWF
jgi:hypothetical protein